MNLLELLVGQDINTYNIDMIFVYIFVLVVAFIICVILSHKLNVYSPKKNNDINRTVITHNHELPADVLDEVAATSVDSGGVEDEK